MKKFRIILALIIATMPVQAFAAGTLPKSASPKKIELYVDDSLRTPKQDLGQIYLDRNTQRVMVPIRFAAEELGLGINYFQPQKDRPQGFLLASRSYFVEVNIGSDEVKYYKTGDYDNQRILKIDAPALIYDQRSYVPIRFLSEVMGYEVKWEDGEVAKVLIDKRAQDEKDREEALKRMEERAKDMHQ